MTPTPEQMWAAIQLAAYDELFFDGNAESSEPIVPCLLCSGFFAPGADAEEVEWSDIPHLRDLYFEGGATALLQWIAERRGVPCMYWREAR